VLRCLGQRHLYYALPKRFRIDAVRLDSGALFFTQNKTFIVQQGFPDLPMAPLAGELSAKQTERFFPATALFRGGGLQSFSRYAIII